MKKYWYFKLEFTYNKEHIRLKTSIPIQEVTIDISLYRVSQLFIRNNFGTSIGSIWLIHSQRISL